MLCVLTIRFRLQPFFIHAVLIALFINSVPASAASFAYLYVEASEGNSSGGHSAIQFGDDIYHYQHHDSGLIRLLRQDKQEFHFLYRFLQNRRIHLSHIEVSEDTYTLLNERFKLQFLAQEQQFKQLHALHKERALLRRLLHNQHAGDAFPDTDFANVLRLNGVGLFYAGQELDSPPMDRNRRDVKGVQSRSLSLMKSIRKKIEQTYGRNYLQHRREQITVSIRTLTPSHWPSERPMLSKDHFPQAFHSFADGYEDDLTGLAAIKVLVEEQPLRADAYFATPESVTREEKRALERLRDQLTLSLIKSANSGRPDWGYAVLVNMTRLVAVDLSIQSGRWVFLDDFAMDSEWVSADQFAQHAEHMQTQINDALTNLKQARNALLTSGGLTETHYSQLEMSANRYFELLKGRENKAIRFLGEKALPTKSIRLPDGLAPELTRQQLKTALSELDTYESYFLQALAEHYRYDLISRNCVTELFRTIDQALLKPLKADADPFEQIEQARNESTKRLGGNISAAYNFIPFMSFQSVQAHYKVTASAVLNSYRGQQLEKLYARNNFLSIRLRESNTFSSTLYAYNPDDAFFVFFTDDNPVLRPIFGLFNTAAGIGQSVFGFLSWPFDAGKNLESGATGVLMSLPELLFFNMRKGSYKYLSYKQFVNDEQLRH